MTKYNCDSPIHKVSSLILAFIILSCFVLPSFVKADGVEPSPSYPPIHPNVPVGWKDGDTIRDVMSVVLDSWGISFTTSGNSLSDDMDDLLDEFYQSQNTTSDIFWDGMQLGVDKLGNLLLNHTTVGRIYQFAQWLIGEYQLSNNMSTSPVISSEYTVGGYPVYYVATSSQRINGYRTQFGSNANYPIFLLPAYEQINGSYQKVTYVFTQSFSSGTTFQIYDSNNALKYQGGFAGNVSGNFAYLQMWPDSYLIPNEPHLARFSSQTAAVNFLKNNVVTQGNIYGDLIINTTVINVPTIDDDDGLVVTVPDSQWGMSLLEILDLISRLIGLYDNTQLEIVSIVETMEHIIDNLQTTVSVDNIPGGVIMDYDDYDIPLENEWGLFDIFYNTQGDEISLFRPWRELVDIVYGFPAPILSFFALVVLFIVAYGFIRMGRDSH